MSQRGSTIDGQRSEPAIEALWTNSEMQSAGYSEFHVDATHVPSAQMPKRHLRNPGQKRKGLECVAQWTEGVETLGTC